MSEWSWSRDLSPRRVPVVCLYICECGRLCMCQHVARVCTRTRVWTRDGTVDVQIIEQPTLCSISRHTRPNRQKEVPVQPHQPLSNMRTTPKQTRSFVEGTNHVDVHTTDHSTDASSLIHQSIRHFQVGPASRKTYRISHSLHLNRNLVSHNQVTTLQALNLIY